MFTEANFEKLILISNSSQLEVVVSSIQSVDDFF